MHAYEMIKEKLEGTVINWNLSLTAQTGSAVGIENPDFHLLYKNTWKNTKMNPNSYAKFKVRLEKRKTLIFSYHLHD